MGGGASSPEIKQETANLKRAREEVSKKERQQNTLTNEVNALYRKINPPQGTIKPPDEAKLKTDHEEKQQSLDKVKDECQKAKLDVAIADAKVTLAKSRAFAAKAKEQFDRAKSQGKVGPAIEKLEQSKKETEAQVKIDVEKVADEILAKEVYIKKTDREKAEVAEKLKKDEEAKKKLELANNEVKKKEAEKKVIESRISMLGWELTVLTTEWRLSRVDKPGAQVTPQVKQARTDLDRCKQQLASAQTLLTKDQQAFEQAKAPPQAGAAYGAVGVNPKDITDPVELKKHESAKKIQALGRGMKAREEVDIKRAESGTIKAAVLDPKSVGLILGQSQPDCPEVSDDLRFDIRDKTAMRVLLQLDHSEKRKILSARPPKYDECFRQFLQQWDFFEEMVPAPVKNQMKMVTLFTSKNSEIAAANPANAIMEATPQQGGYDRRPRAESWSNSVKRKYLLGKYDCLAVPVHADYDARFMRIIHPSTSSTVAPTAAPKAGQPVADLGPAQQALGGKSSAGGVVSGSNPSEVNAIADTLENDVQLGDRPGMGWFWMIHAAAINIGETANAEDFDDYAIEDVNNTGGYYSRFRSNKKLKVEDYLRDMEEIWRNILLSMDHLKVEDAVMFPFGMGAFLRSLKKNDSSYSGEDGETKMKQLRYGIAMGLMHAIAKVLVTPGLASRSVKRVHLCLVNITAESLENHNAFVSAAKDKAAQCPQLKDIVHFRQNMDVLQVAHELSVGSTKPLTVAALNGANRKLMGNHWFQHGARLAIDENLHRRSSSMARVSLLLNKGTLPITRRFNDLEDHVRKFGGKVLDLPSDGSVTLPSAQGTSPAPAAAPATNAKASAANPTSAPVTGSPPQAGEPKAAGGTVVSDPKAAAPKQGAVGTNPDPKAKAKPKSGGGCGCFGGGKTGERPPPKAGQTGTPPVKAAGGQPPAKAAGAK